MTQTFDENVIIDGVEDVPQLRVQGEPTQTEPLQTWESDSGEVYGQVTADGRLQFGDDLSTPETLVEAHRDDDPEDVSSKPKRGFHSLGRIVNLLTDVIAWAVAEVELIGANGVSGLQTALRIKLTHNNTGDSTNAELRAGDFEAVNLTGTVSEPVDWMAGARGTLTNEADAYLNKGYGLEAAIHNAGTMNEAALFDGKPIENDGDIGILYGLRIPDIVDGTTGNIGIQTGRGPVQFGDEATAEAYKVGAVQTATLASDTLALVAIPVLKSFYRVSAQSGTSDDLATISGGTGNLLVFLQAASGHTITVKHGTGNISLNGASDFVLSGEKTLLLFFDGTNWADLGAGGGVAISQLTGDVTAGPGSGSQAATVASVGGASAANVADAVTKRHTQNTDTGTTQVSFQIDSGSSGPRIKDSSGELQVRNAADNDFVNFRAAQAIFSSLHLLIGGVKAIFTHAFTADRTVTIPGDANVTLVGLVTTQSPTNKTFDNSNHIVGEAIDSGTVAAARLGVMTGDSGSGGAKGAVPAPATGDATKFLRGDASWATVPASGVTTIKENASNIVTAADTLDFKDFNVEDLGSGDAAIYHDIPALCAGRLTLETGVAISTSDQTAKTTMYFTPYKGGKISLYDGTRWKVYSFSELNVAVPSTLFRLFDVFIYDNAGTLSLETVNWDQTTGAISGATNASPIVLTVASGHGLSVGDLIGCSGLAGNTAPNGKVWRVSATAATTVTLEGSVGNGAYTSGGTWYRIPNTRSTSLTTQDGVLVKSGATTRRYLGTGMTTGTSGQTEDSLLRRYLYNYYNRVLRNMRVTDTTNTWTYGGLTPHFANANTDNRIQFVVGIVEEPVAAHVTGNYSGGVSGTLGIGLDTSTTNHAQVFTAGPGGTFMTSSGRYEGNPSVGYHFFAWEEFVGAAGSNTFIGDNNTTWTQSGLTGDIFA